MRIEISQTKKGQAANNADKTRMSQAIPFCDSERSEESPIGPATGPFTELTRDVSLRST
jgi:hypothetical protein